MQSARGDGTSHNGRLHRLIVTACLGLVVVDSVRQTPAAAPDLSRADRIAQAAEQLRAKLVETRRDFHMHPELSYDEERTARVVAERLRALGLDEIRTNVAKHGVVALL